jgi:hypothetical protein
VMLMYDGVSKSFRTGRLEWEMQILQLSAIRCNCIAILWVSLVSFAAVTLCVASQHVFIVVVYFVIDSVRELLDITLYGIVIYECEKNCDCYLVLRAVCRMDVKTALKHPWLQVADKIPVDQFKINTENLRNYYNRYR